MELRVYNTLTRSKEPFSPIEPSKVRMFVCGPTVYDYMHIGNARTFTFFDIVARTLRAAGLKLDYIMNITDIDDKIIARAQKEGRDPLELSRDYTDKFLKDMEALGNTAVSNYPRATDHIPEVIAQVKSLRDKKHAYLIEGDGWYFDLKTFANYGKLSGRTESVLDDGVSRIDDSDKKRSPGDFCLWKFSKPGEPSWPSELGVGRPGWHIEDTAITGKYFGPQYDLHGGGQDLMFPHHEAEIAQQECASGLSPFVRYWMHAAFVSVDGRKMSKSLGNFYTLRDIEAKGYSPMHFRYLILGTHYRQQLNFTWESLEAAKNAYAKLVRNTAEGITPKDHLEDRERDVLGAFNAALCEDLNTPQALSVLWSSFDLEEAVYKMDEVLGLNLKDAVAKFRESRNQIPDEIQKLNHEREEARLGKDWGKADELRRKMAELGWGVEDTAEGPRLAPL